MARRYLDIPGDLPLHHRIVDLWSELHQHLLAIAPGDSVAKLAEVRRLIGEFSAVDPTSMAFRYPEDKNGNPSLPGLTHINLRNVRDVIEKVNTLLGGAGSHVGAMSRKLLNA